MTAEEIREKIIDTVAANGGHLSPSLGAVELCMALRESFDPLKDRIVWDVGHQAYAWKILTGRDAEFGTIRKLGGLSGFTTPQESCFDAAVAGHAGVALSIAEGYAAARQLKGTDEHVVAVVGDSSLVNGTSFEAMNFAASASKVILVLNDNGMSISKPSGSFSRFLGRLIAGARYNRVKNAARAAGRAMRLSFMHGFAHRLKARIKSFFLGDGFFNKFGFRYLGPVDGHDVNALKAALEVAKAEENSVIIHVVTKKGKGWRPAERNPTKWHGTGPFDRAAAEAGEGAAPSKGGISWSAAFGEALIAAAERDSRIVALTAGMKDGTGLAGFAARFPDRFFDVGIAEGHMVAFAAGLAQGGMKPVVAVYSTFMQRAVDQLAHDCAIAGVPVVFALDRAGVVGADGKTHQGVFDIAMLKALPNVAICQPRDAEDLRELLDEALERNGPTVIRYPRGKADRALRPRPAAANAKGALAVEMRASCEKPAFAIWALGDWLERAEEVAAALGGVAVHARYVKPFDAETLARERAAGMKIVSLENASVAGGFGESIGADLKLGWPDEFVPHGSQAELERMYSLDTAGVKTAVERFMSKERKG